MPLFQNPHWVVEGKTGEDESKNFYWNPGDMAPLLGGDSARTPEHCGTCIWVFVSCKHAMQLRATGFALHFGLT